MVVPGSGNRSACARRLPSRSRTRTSLIDAALKSGTTRTTDAAATEQFRLTEEPARAVKKRRVGADK